MFTLYRNPTEYEKISRIYETIARQETSSSVNEKTAFYQLEHDTEEAPKIPKAELLGTIDSREKGKEVAHAVKAYTIIESVSEWLEQAGWGNSKIISPRTLAEKIFINGIHSEDIQKIVANRSKLGEIFTAIKSNKPFNLNEKLFEGISPFVSSSKESFFNLFSWLYTLKGEEKGTNVGPSEILITLFSNSEKPQAKGDIAFENVIIEAKGGTVAKSGAALGYAPYAMEVLRATLIKLAKRHKAEEPFLSQKIYATRSALKKYFGELKQARDAKIDFAKSLITDKFFETANEIISKLGLEEAEKILQKSGLAELAAIPLRQKTDFQNFVNVLKNKGYISDKPGISLNDPLPNEQIVRVFKKKGGKNFSGAIDLLIDRQEFAKKNLPTESFITQLKNSSLSIALKEFCCGGGEKTKEELLEVFLAARPKRECRSDLKSSLEGILTESVLTEMQQGDVEILKGIIFAIQASEYAFSEGFDYLLLSNLHAKYALPIPVKNDARKLFDFYQAHKDKIVFTINYSERQGAHNLSIR